MADDAPAKRPGGRRPLDPAGPAASLSLKIPTKEYDRLCVEALKQRVTLSSLVREVLAAKLRQL